MNFGDVNRKLVLFHVGFVRLLEAAVGSLGLAQRFVQVEVMRTGVDDAAGDVGAVVGCALKVGQKIGEDKASLNAAMALLHAQDVARAHLLFERVDDLLERLDLLGERDVLRGEGLERERKDLADGGGENGELVEGAAGEREALLLHLLSGGENVDRVVRNALKVADGLE